MDVLAGIERRSQLPQSFQESQGRSGIGIMQSVREGASAAEGRKNWEKMSEIRCSLVVFVRNAAKMQSSLKNYAVT